MDMEKLRSLIDDYMAMVDVVISRLHSEISEKDLLLGANTNKFDREGELGNGEYYFFHGMGCRVLLGEVVVDFEFAPDGGTGGFDAWCLCQFAESFPERYPDFQEHLILEAALDEAVRIGELIRPGNLPNRSLCYVKYRK